jgi:hypothetical protein
MRRVVEVYSHWPNHDACEPEWSCGSGYALGGKLVLTAAHVVWRDNNQPEAVAIRADGSPKLLNTEVAWWKYDDHVDAALLLVIDDDWHPPNSANYVRWGKLVTRQPGVPCEATGFPEVVATPARRDTEQASGTINPGALTKSGLLSVRIESPPERVVTDASPWGGMSGSAVFCGGLLTGVVTQDPAGFDSRRLLAVPIVSFSADEDFVGLVAKHTRRDLALEAVEFAALALPPMRADSPASLLRADIAPMRFRDRPETEALLAWAESGGPVSVRLLHGPGGQGKTRLARHVAAKLATNGWATVLISDAAPLEQMPILKSAIVPTFIVVDYAESRPYQLSSLAGIIMNAEERVRVLLLARSPGSWQARLATISAYTTIFSNAPGSGLGSLETEVSGRQEAWMEAVESLAAHLGRLEGYEEVAWLEVSKQLIPPALHSERYSTILAVQEDALATMLTVGVPAYGGPDPLDVLLAHESRYWTKVAGQAGIELSLATQQRAVACASLWGAADEREAERVLRPVPGLRDLGEDQRLAVAEWLSGLYVAPDRYWSRVQPDRLAEHLLGAVLRDNDCPTLLSGSVKRASSVQKEHAATLLRQASGRYPHLGVELEKLSSSMSQDVAKSPQVYAQDSLAGLALTTTRSAEQKIDAAEYGSTEQFSRLTETLGQLISNLASIEADVDQDPIFDEATALYQKLLKVRRDG